MFVALNLIQASAFFIASTYFAFVGRRFRRVFVTLVGFFCGRHVIFLLIKHPFIHFLIPPLDINDDLINLISNFLGISSGVVFYFMVLEGTYPLAALNGWYFGGFLLSPASKVPVISHLAFRIPILTLCATGSSLIAIFFGNLLVTISSANVGALQIALFSKKIPAIAETGTISYIYRQIFLLPMDPTKNLTLGAIPIYLGTIGLALAGVFVQIYLRPKERLELARGREETVIIE